MSCTGGDQYFRNSSKGQELYPFCCSASYISSSQLPEGFAVTHLLSSCTLFSKLCPGSKTSHLRPGFQSALKSTGISDMFWKLLHLIRARGNIIHAGLKSVGLAGLQIIPLLFNLPRRTAFNMLWNPPGYDDCLENSVMTMIAGQFTVQIWGHSSLPGELLIAIFDSYFFINSSEKSEGMNPVQCIYSTVWSWAQLFSWPIWHYWNLVNRQFRNT